MSLHQRNLMIGLGGAGALAIANFRKLTHSTRKKEFGLLGVKMQYLCIDSSCDNFPAATQKKDFTEHDQKRLEDLWEHHGDDLKLNDNDYFRLEPTGIQEIIDIYNEGHEEKIPPINDPSIGAGQFRAYGRAMFRVSGDDIAGAIRERVQVLINGVKDADVTIHIFTTCSGGTGSGGLIDIIATAKAICVEQGAPMSQIIVYLFVAGSKIGADNIGSSYLNQYYVLRDLDALATKRYTPSALTEDLTNRYKSSLVRASGQHIAPPITRIYISSDYKTNRSYIKGQIPDMAEICFDAIGASKGGVMTRAFTGEDLLSGKPGEPEITDDQKPDNSFNYAVAGTKRWAYPLSEIKVMLQQKFKNFVLQLWLDGVDRKDLSQRDMTVLIEHKPVEITDGEVLFPTSKLRKVLKDFQTEKEGGLRAIFEKNDCIKTMTEGALSFISDISVNDKRITDFNEAIESDATVLEEALKDLIQRTRVWNVNVSPVGLRRILVELKNLKARLETEPETVTVPAADIDAPANVNLLNRHASWELVGSLNSLIGSTKGKLKLEQQEELTHIFKCHMAEYRRIKYTNLREKLCAKLGEIILQFEGSIDILSGVADKAKEIYDEEHSKITDCAKRQAESHVFYDINSEDFDNFLRLYNDINANITELQRIISEDFEPVWRTNIREIEQIWNSESRNSLIDEMGSIVLNLYGKYHDYIAKKLGKEILLSSLYDRILQKTNDKTDPESLRTLVLPTLRTIINSLTPSAALEKSTSKTVKAGGNTPPQSALVLGLPLVEDSIGSKDTGETKSRYTHAQRKAIYDYFKANYSTLLQGNVVVADERRASYELAVKDHLRIMYLPYWMPVRYISVLEHTHTECKSIWAELEDENIETRLMAKGRVLLAQIDDLDHQKRDICLSPQEQIAKREADAQAEADRIEREKQAIKAAEELQLRIRTMEELAGKLKFDNSLCRELEASTIYLLDGTRDVNGGFNSFEFDKCKSDDLDSAYVESLERCFNACVAKHHEHEEGKKILNSLYGTYKDKHTQAEQEGNTPRSELIKLSKIVTLVRELLKLEQN